MNSLVQVSEGRASKGFTTVATVETAIHRQKATFARRDRAFEEDPGHTGEVATRRV